MLPGSRRTSSCTTSSRNSTSSRCTRSFPRPYSARRPSHKQRLVPCRPPTIWLLVQRGDGPFISAASGCRATRGGCGTGALTVVAAVTHGQCAARAVQAPVLSAGTARLHHPLAECLAGAKRTYTCVGCSEHSRICEYLHRLPFHIHRLQHLGVLGLQGLRQPCHARAYLGLEFGDRLRVCFQLLRECL